MLYLRDLLRRASVLELAIAFGIAYAVVSWVHELVLFVMEAAWHYSLRSGGRSSTIFGLVHLVDTPPYSLAQGAVSYGETVAWTLTLAILLALVAAIGRLARQYLWDDTDLRDCPFCLSPIPIAASVCDSCTRDVAAA
jgi:hypothetical protein